MSNEEQLTLFEPEEVGIQIKRDREQRRNLPYDEFLQKFQPKKTTDDCYTPPLVFDAVADYCFRHYGVERSDIVRPFYPGGDYMNHDYPDGCAVVDNPPFSILKKIIQFYTMHRIRFFLFAPTLNGLTRYADFCTVIVTGCAIVYENGASVNTSFATNMEPPHIRARTCPELFRAVKGAVQKTMAGQSREIPKYVFPSHVISPAAMWNYSRYGLEFEIPRDESQMISALDSMRRNGKTIFGAGWIMSERLATEREKLEREKLEREKSTVWTLSERERAIIQRLSRKETE